MGCCNELATALDSAVFDPSQHVNFAKGMVLGVDDFRQEFAYLSGRDQWLVRDAVGYGTASGLRVFFENDGSEGPRLHVTAGSAFLPGGKQVCVGADQCAVINKWLAKPDHAATVTELLNPGSPAPSPSVTSGTVSLFLTLCYTDCRTRPVPVPGEPCRSEDELMADSRVADDFRLELQKSAPIQVEEDAVRDFARWLRANVEIADASASPAGDDASWLASLRPAAQAWLDAARMSPPTSPPASLSTLGDYLSDLSPSNLVVSRAEMCDFLRVAFRFWVTELRPLWMARRCHREMLKDQDCVLLARIEFDVEFVGGSPSGVWQIVGTPPVVRIDETTRPFLAHVRLLQEWLWCGCECGGLGGTAPPLGESLPLAIDTPIAAGGLTTGQVPVSKIGADATLDESHFLVLATGAASLTLTLPPSNSANAGRLYIVKNVDVTKLTVAADAAAGDTIGDQPNLGVKTKNAVTLIADGAGGWQLVATVV